MATTKLQYGTTTTMTLSLASLGTSSSRVAGRESTAVDNTTNLFDDVLVSGYITTGTTPTANKVIEVWVYAAPEQSSPVYPASMTGSDAAYTFSSEYVKWTGCRLGATLLVPNTSDTAYWFKFNIAGLYGFVPPFWGIFVVHDTVASLNSTAGNHVVKYLGITYQTA
jgi:hypothetical protein